MNRATLNTYWFHGNDQGNWERTHYFARGSWFMAPGLALVNERKNFSVEGATEYHPGFRAALREIMNTYPELLEWLLSFDGPFRTVPEVLTTLPLSWEHTEFYHGTSEAAWGQMHSLGLCPRAITKSAIRINRPVDFLIFSITIRDLLLFEMDDNSVFLCVNPPPSPARTFFARCHVGLWLPIL